MKRILFSKREVDRTGWYSRQLFYLPVWWWTSKNVHIHTLAYFISNGFILQVMLLVMLLLFSFYSQVSSCTSTVGHVLAKTWKRHQIAILNIFYHALWVYKSKVLLFQFCILEKIQDLCLLVKRGYATFNIFHHLHTSFLSVSVCMYTSRVYVSFADSFCLRYASD